MGSSSSVILPDSEFSSFVFVSIDDEDEDDDNDTEEGIQLKLRLLLLALLPIDQVETLRVSIEVGDEGDSSPFVN
jgi:hypothetical protein